MLSIGLLGFDRLDARWMRRELDEVRSSTAAQHVTHFAQLFRDTIKNDDARLTADNAYFEANYGPVCDGLEREDRQLLRDLKLAIRAGVVVFEECEQATIMHGRERLLAALQSIPPLLNAYYERLASSLVK
jgi:hypothetical protein